MIRVAEVNRLEGRFVILGGHTVSLIETPSGPVVADPDYGVTFRANLAELEGPEREALMEEALERRGYGESTRRKYISYFQTADNNVVLDHGIFPSPDLYRLERSAEWLKWIVPALFLAFGMICRHRG
jgi:hypothetical protein